jgi:uncharacterized membrane protein YdjX (TVP38/TMEM64 family)
MFRIASALPRHPVNRRSSVLARNLSLIRLAIVPVVAVVALVTAWKLGYFSLEHRERLLHFVQELRRLPGTQAVYVLFYALLIALVLPATIPSIVGGALFGWWEGAFLAWLGALAGTTLSHLLARHIARKPARRLFGEHRLLRELKDHDDVLSLLRLRILPIAPFAVLDYAAGVAGVRLRQLLMATMVGILPSVVAYTYVGSEIIRGIAEGNNAAHRALWVAAAVTVGMMVVSAVPALLQRLRG